MDIPFGANSSEPTPGSTPPVDNFLLSKLSSEDLAALLSDANEVAHDLRDVLFEEGQAITHVCFPLTGMVSLLTVLKDGTSLESLTVGYEGMTGLPLFHGVPVERSKGVCQIAGKFISVPADAFMRFVQASTEMQRILHRYSQFVKDAIAQFAACNSVHSMEQRCARWILLTSDAARSDSFRMTHESVAQMLGVRRPGVTIVMGGLERKRLVESGRARVTILDRPGLRRVCCECYQTTAALRDTLLA